MTSTKTILHYLFALMLATLAFTAQANEPPPSDQLDIEKLLEKETAPDGVVFELIGNDGYYLESALQRVNDYSERLREKFPELEIAVVSHGIEQFAFKSSQAEDNAESHLFAKQFLEKDIPVHVCETHAGWLGVTAEDFPEYINVAPSGPAQINQYRELGYELVIVE